MTDEPVPHGLSAHTHGGSLDTTDILPIDGRPVVVSVDDETLWTCDPRGGECVSRSLDLESAEPDDVWYFENEHWDEDDDEYRPRLETDGYNLCGQVTTTHLDGRPVVITGGRRYDFDLGDDDDSGGVVRAWDIGTGTLTGKLMAGHVLGVTALTTVPHQRGRIVVSTCETGMTLAWDLTDFRRLAEIEGAYNGVMDAASVAGRPIAVTGGDADHVQVWDLLTGDEIGEPLAGFNGPIGAITVAELDGRTVVLVSDDRGVHVRDLAARDAVGSPLTGHAEQVVAMGAASFAGRTIAVTSDDPMSADARQETRFWDLATGEQLGEPVSGRLEKVSEVLGRPIAVTADGGRGVRLWDLARL